jgi:acetyl-CoA synthetase
MAGKVTTEVNNVLKPVDAPELHHMTDYEVACRTFSWEQVHPEFDWAQTGKVNMAHEAIDRQLTRGRRNKLALVYTDRERTSRFTFEDLCLQSNRFANALRKLGVRKRRSRVRLHAPSS